MGAPRLGVPLVFTLADFVTGRLGTAALDNRAVPPASPRNGAPRPFTGALFSDTGDLKEGNLEESIYEGYAAGGVAVLCEILTDNKNRTAPEIRKIFEVCDGKLGATGCVWLSFRFKNSCGP